MGPNYPYLFVIMDTVPEYVQKTFELDEDGRYTGNASIQTVREGDDIPKDLEFAVVIYNFDDWHMDVILHLASQIQETNPGAKVMWLPVRG